MEGRTQLLATQASTNAMRCDSLKSQATEITWLRGSRQNLQTMQIDHLLRAVREIFDTASAIAELSISEVLAKRGETNNIPNDCGRQAQ